ncbi:MAG: HEPN domain-containing protein [Candidatus Caenarcaniphilales bacterium]|nr:HEPN domain-containing protein [Candidatus Caenarcaniphilales bacterium]
MDKATENWLKIAEKDLKAAKVLLKAEENMSVIFHLHAALEKILKAIVTSLGAEPPKIHNLKRLAVDCCKIKLEKHREEIFVKLDKSFIDTRYPEDIDECEEKYNLNYCKGILKDVEVTFKWLKDLLMKN